MLSHETLKNRIEDAIRWATLAHAGQVDKQGQPYILHCLRVGLAGETEEEKIVGFLHDVLEDVPNFPLAAIESRFTEVVVEALLAITRNKGESYEDYIERVAKNDVARAVKLNDLRDNLSRFPSQTSPEWDRLAKRYRLALVRLAKTPY